MAKVKSFALFLIVQLSLSAKSQDFDGSPAKLFEKNFYPSYLSETSKSSAYKIDDRGGLGRTFDGIGGISGGGATSRLLVNYPETYRNEVLDYLFLPNFGASLHILKVEIGGDAQSTDGTEPCHMRSPDDENYNRGYEWWLMKEAKLRNPNVKLAGLTWGWPRWLGQGAAWPYANISLTSTYIAKWVQGAKDYHNLTIDYVGLWNGRPYDIDYIKLLRKTLDSFGLNHVLIIAADQHISKISENILQDKKLADAVGVIGSHYPGTMSAEKALETKKPLWASEDYSTFDNEVGAGCWARILNQNYVNGQMTATIAWNLVASYYDNLPFKRDSLMTANEPWSGHYVVSDPVWVTSHTTQFTQPGWSYLHTVGHLEKGGSYVSLTDGKGNLTIIIETMTHSQSICIRPWLPEYTVESQNASFEVEGSFKGTVNKLRYWMSQLGPNSTSDQMFMDKGVVTVDSTGIFNVHLPTNVVVTLSTINTAKKGQYPTPPVSAPFPIPYSENFDPNVFSEASNFADQAGAFETFYNETGGEHKYTLRQMVTERPITWCDDPNLGFTLIGDYTWSAVNASVAVKNEGSDGIFLALRVDKGGCKMRQARGLYFWLRKCGVYTITTDIGRGDVLKTCAIHQECWNPAGTEIRDGLQVKLGKDQTRLAVMACIYLEVTVTVSVEAWNKMSLAIDKKGNMYAYLNGQLIWKETVKANPAIPTSGYVAMGTDEFSLAQFDDFSVFSLL